MKEVMQIEVEALEREGRGVVINSAGTGLPRHTQLRLLGDHCPTSGFRAASEHKSGAPYWAGHHHRAYCNRIMSYNIHELYVYEVRCFVVSIEIIW
jgi:hypothetical protein